MTLESANIEFESSPIPERAEPASPGGSHRESAPPRGPNYFVRHWRGGFSLGVSLWVNGLLAMFSLRLLGLVQQALPTAWYELPGAVRALAVGRTLSLGL